MIGHNNDFSFHFENTLEKYRKEMENGEASEELKNELYTLLCEVARRVIKSNSGLILDLPSDLPDTYHYYYGEWLLDQITVGRISGEKLPQIQKYASDHRTLIHFLQDYYKTILGESFKEQDRARIGKMAIKKAHEEGWCLDDTIRFFREKVHTYLCEERVKNYLIDTTCEEIKEWTPVPEPELTARGACDPYEIYLKQEREKQPDIGDLACFDINSEAFLELYKHILKQDPENGGLKISYIVYRFFNGLYSSTDKSTHTFYHGHNEAEEMRLLREAFNGTFHALYDDGVMITFPEDKKYLQSKDTIRLYTQRGVFHGLNRIETKSLRAAVRRLSKKRSITDVLGYGISWELAEALGKSGMSGNDV